MRQIHWKQKKKEKTYDRGFSLVELIVTMAILSVVGLAIVSFLSFCLNQYKKSHSEVGVQSKVQVVQNQIDNFMLNTNRAVYLEKNDPTKDAVKKLWLIGEKEREPSHPSSPMNIEDWKPTGEYHAACISYNDTTGEMTFQRFNCTKADPQKEEYTVQSIAGQGEQKLVDEVDSFAVKIQSKKLLTVTMEVHNGKGNSKRSYTTSFDVTSRNPLKEAESVTLDSGTP
ncbi:MAG: PilW family protein [Lachnospiraceae bacterium]